MSNEDELLEKAEADIDAKAYGIEALIIGIMAARLGNINEGASASEALSHIAQDMAQISRVASKGAAELSAAAAAAVSGLDEVNAEWAAPMYEATGAAATGAAAAAVTSGAEDAAKAIRATCRTSVMGLATAKGTGFIPLAKAYRAAVTSVATDMASGRLTREKAVSQAVRELCRGGLRVVSYDGEAQKVRELHSAVRMNVTDAYSRAMAKSRAAIGEEVGADGVEISAHGTCAPDHLPYQGKQFSKARFERLQARLERPIAEGYNCRHIAFPIILGVSKPAYTKEKLAEVERLSNGEVTFTVNGEEKSLTRYEFTQYQRRMETSIRKARLEAYAYKQGSVDDAAAKRRVREMLKSYRAVSEEAGMTPRMELTRIYIPR